MKKSLEELKKKYDFVYKLAEKLFIIGFGVFEEIKDKELEKLFEQYEKNWKDVECETKKTAEKDLVETYRSINEKILDYNIGFDEKRNREIDLFLEKINKSEADSIEEQLTKFLKIRNLDDRFVIAEISNKINSYLNGVKT